MREAGMDEARETPGEAKTPEGAPAEAPLEPGEKRPPISRRVALLVGLAVAVVLALGWGADSLGVFAPTVHFTNGETQQAGAYRVALTLDPAAQRAGQPEHFNLTVTDAAGRLVNGLRVALRLRMVTMEMPDVSMAAKASGNGVYTATGTTSMPGEWRLDVTLAPPMGSAAQTMFDLSAH